MTEFLNLRGVPQMLASVLVTLMLGACGGGGGAAPATGAGAVVTSYIASNIVTTPAASPTYAGGSEEAQAFALINAERTACGFGSVSQNTNLDAAALGHVNWMIVNNYASTHIQEVNFSAGPAIGTPTAGFTGVNPVNRTQVAGYVQTDATKITDEGSAVLGTSNKVGYGVHGIRSLLGAPYHLAGMVGEYREIGLTVRSGATAGADITAPAGAAPRALLWADLGYNASATAQLVASDQVLTYPCQGSTGTVYSLSNETPNPVPGRNLAVSPLGQPIYLQARLGNTLTITSASMTQVSNSAVVTLRAAITSANDPNGPCAKGCYLSHMAYVIPDAPLLQNTQYQVIVNGTNNGVPFTRSFTFTTGNVAA